MATQPTDTARINLIVPTAERDVFDRWCRYGGKRLSMTARLRQLMHADAAGKVALPRDAPPLAKPPRKRDR